MAGLLFCIIACAIKKQCTYFLSNSTGITGKIIGINQKERVSKNMLGVITQRKKIFKPIVSYQYQRNYLFTANLDANQHGLNINDDVIVLINPARPNTAKLKIALYETQLISLVFAILGIISITIGLYCIDTNLIKNIQNVGMGTIIMGIILLAFTYFKIAPISRLLTQKSFEQNNAEEV